MSTATTTDALYRRCFAFFRKVRACIWEDEKSSRCLVWIRQARQARQACWGERIRFDRVYGPQLRVFKGDECTVHFHAAVSGSLARDPFACEGPERQETCLYFILLFFYWARGDEGLILGYCT